MFAKAAEDVQGKLTGSLFELLFTPAAFFWLAGLVVWEIADPHRLKDLANTLTTLGDVKLLLYSGAALALVVFSGAAYEPVTGGSYNGCSAIGGRSTSWARRFEHCCDPESPKRSTASRRTERNRVTG